MEIRCLGTIPKVGNFAVRRTQPQRKGVDACDIPLPNCGGSGPPKRVLSSEAASLGAGDEADSAADEDGQEGGGGVEDGGPGLVDC